MIDFATLYPSYASTSALDDLRLREYPLLDAEGHVYLDYTAANLSPRSLIARHTDLLQSRLLGNPHSTNPASALTTELVRSSTPRLRSGS